MFACKGWRERSGPATLHRPGIAETEAEERLVAVAQSKERKQASESRKSTLEKQVADERKIVEQIMKIQVAIEKNATRI